MSARGFSDNLMIDALRPAKPAWIVEPENQSDKSARLRGVLKNHVTF
jgi:hypothetical protein